MKILLVDDEQKFASMLSKRLELRGFQVKACFSGEEALDAVRRGDRFDTAILDIKMPGIGGIELKRKLCQLDPHTRFVFLTGHGSNDECIQEDINEFSCLPKPLNIDTLIEILNRLSATSGNAADPGQGDEDMDPEKG